MADVRDGEVDVVVRLANESLEITPRLMSQRHQTFGIACDRLDIETLQKPRSPATSGQSLGDISS